MFEGSSSVIMDDKGRFAIPKEFRESLLSACDGQITVTAHDKDRCLLIYPRQTWLRIKEQIDDLPTSDVHSSRMQRLMVGLACHYEVDANPWRVPLTQGLRDFARLEKKLHLCGNGKKLELWSDSLWNGYVDDEEYKNSEPSPEYNAIKI